MSPRRDITALNAERSQPGCQWEGPEDPPGLSRLMEVAILCALARDDATRRAYLRDRWQGRIPVRPANEDAGRN
ncbi:MAG TPA: hypothetical protein VNK52_13180 [Hyphomicrobiaceae bacterium]|nr:hypothetical protein [Hyphomicrobiaceae bacterium]